MKRWISLLLLVMLVACAKSEEVLAREQLERYVSTLNGGDLEGQMEILAPFKISPQDYQSTFLQYVQRAEERLIDKKFENELIIIMELQMDLTLKEAFPPNGRLKPGMNHLTRYFTFMKKDMKLIEILDKLILQEEEKL